MKLNLNIKNYDDAYAFMMKTSLYYSYFPQSIHNEIKQVYAAFRCCHGHHHEWNKEIEQDFALAIAEIANKLKTAHANA